METKACTKCFRTLPLEDFVKSKQRKSGLGSWCKECARKVKRESNARVKSADPDGFAKRRRAYVAKYKSIHADRVRESGRARDIVRRFGVTIQQYEEMLEGQGGTCATCKSVPESKRFAVDHDHSCCSGQKTCGKCIRGLLCSNCNTALGLVKDSTDTLKKMIDYLKEGN